MEIHSMRIEHGPIQANTMSYPQRQPQNHRPNHNQTSLTADIYKPSRSPLSTARYPYPSSPQLQQSTAPTINQVQIQRYQQVQQASAPPPVSASQPSSVAAPQSAPPPPQLLSGVFREYRQNRISLLHPEYGTGRADRAAAAAAAASVSCGGRVGGDQPILYSAPPSGVVCIDSGSMASQGGGPLKKLRVQEKEAMQPLRIDTRPGMYNPQVEAISPILPDQMAQDDQAFRATKDELIQQIAKVDREIAKAESQISILKKKQCELEEIAKKPAVKPEVEEDTTPKHQSLPQKIYAENYKKAQSKQAELDSLGSKVDWPLYNQPTDATIYHENKIRHMTFKVRLLEYFKRKNAEKESRNLYLTETYSKMMQDWLRKVDKIESSTKRKAKEARNREFFEKVFPELRKQREDKERFNRVGARIKSEADMEEIMDNLQEQALEDKKMRSYAVIPPILLEQREKKIKFDNNNGYIEDMETVYKSRQFVNLWTPSEKEIFKEKYLQHPKNFVVIASYLDRKSVADCVQYYYLSKKTENYKQLFRKARQRTRNRNNAQKVNNANTAVADILTTGVTTRLQKEQARIGGQQLVRETNQNLEPPASTTPPATATTTATCSTPSTIASPSILTVATDTTPTSTSATNSVTTSNLVDSSSPSTTLSDVVGTISTTSTVSTMVTGSNSNSCTASAINTLSTNTSSLSISTSVISTSSSCAPLIPTIAVSASGVSAVVSSSDLVLPMEIVDDDKSNVKTFLGFGAIDDYQNSNKFFNAADGSVAVVSGAAGSKDRGAISSVGDTTTTTTNILLDGQIKMEVAIKNENDSPHEGLSEQNMTSTPLMENKKKKERRKEKDTSAVETSDEEANTLQDKTNQGCCAVCQSQLGAQLHSRPLIPSQAMQYGLREDQVPPNSRVCNTCHCKILRSHYTHCPLPACPNSRVRVKRLRSLPYRLQDLPSDIKESLMAEFRIPSGVTKCCSACFNRIQRRLGPVEDWPEEEFNKLKTALSELGSNWQLIGERLNKPPQKVKMFCAANRKRLKGCLGEDRKPTVSTDEESGSSTSSCEESLLGGDRHSSDTASAAESPPVQGTGDNQTKRVDYDSSATETADEAQTPDHYQGSATITPVTSDGQTRPNAALSVKDLVLNMIEISLMKNTNAQQAMQNPPTSGITPTISSILNNDSNEVTIVSEYNLNNINHQPQRPPTQQRPDINIAKLVNPLIAATITPVTGPIPTQPQPEPIQSSRDDLVVLQVPDGREPETLDLSIKKPREPPPQSVNKHQSQQPQQIHRSEPSYIYHQERKSPAFSNRHQTKLPSPKPANPKAGSITLGTPVLTQTARYDVLRQMPDAKMGSITQGTPIQMPHNLQDKRVYDYMNKRGPMPPQQNPAQQPQYPGQYRQAAYTMEQQLSSRQTIINDYITSQQMLGRRNEKPQYYPTNSSHRTPPPAQQTQQRQGVIQRHTRPQYLQPGQEVLSTFVDLAVQQPSLPVPNAPHEGLGKTMADNIMEQPHRYQLYQQQQQQQQLRQQHQRMEEHRRATVYHQQQQSQQAQQRQQQPRSDASTLTAASLIDAIITHQINQTAEGPREVVNNARETRAGDLLFQNFHRGDAQQSTQSQQHQHCQENNDCVRPASVISVDLDGDGINKNLTVKELTDSVISHDFGATRQANYYQLQENMNEQWKRRIQQQQQQQHKDDKRSQTPQQQQDERQIIRIAQPQQKYHLERVEPVSPPENNHWSEQNYRRYPQSQPHISPLDYVKNRIVEVMRTEDDKKDNQDQLHGQDKERSDSPGDMVIDEEKHDNDFGPPQVQQSQHQQQPPSGFYTFVHKDTSTANDNSRNNEPQPLLSSQYDPLSDEDE